MMTLYQLNGKLKRRLKRIKKIELLFGLNNSKSEKIKLSILHTKIELNSNYGLFSPTTYEIIKKY